jgi:hypothetical protein
VSLELSISLTEDISTNQNWIRDNHQIVYSVYTPLVHLFAFTVVNASFFSSETITHLLGSWMDRLEKP